MRSDHADPKLELRHLVQNRGVNFDLDFSEVLISSVVQQLDLTALRKAKFSGTILPLEQGDWVLSGALGASVEQPCSLTLVPVRTRIDIPVVRNFRKSKLQLADTSLESESNYDDNDEELNQVIDILCVFCEALSLELPDYPRTENVVATTTEYGPPGTAALTDVSVKPFAVLAELKKRLE
tara:strand:+ start:302 stop:844 length:543 start_codon:yes stop_codon:yes gene_type:complete